MKNTSAQNEMLLSDAEKSGIISIIIAIFTFGSLANVAICFVYRRVQLLQKLPSVLIINLAVCDLLMCLNTGFMIHGLNSGSTGPSRLLCDISGYIKFVLTFSSFAFVMLIMVRRYCYVALYDSDKCKHIKLAIASIWLYHMILGLAPIFGWSRFTFSPGKLACTCRIRTSLSFSIVVAVTSMVGPLFVLLFCSVRIFQKLRQTRTFFAQGSLNQSQRKRDEIRGTIILFSVIFNYLVCAVPFIVVNLMEIFDSDFVIPIRLDIATAIITQFMPAINPVIFGFGNERFRKAFLKLICRSRSRKIRPAVKIKENTQTIGAFRQCRAGALRRSLCGEQQNRNG